MKKMTIFFLCLALISLACLETSSAVISTTEPAKVATRIEEVATFAAPAMVTTTPTEFVTRICARVVAARSLNLRIDAGTSAEVIGDLWLADVVTVLDRENAEWWHVKRGDDIGFARSIFLEEVRCDDEQP